MFVTQNNLDETVRVEMISLMNKCLASSIDLALQAKQAHWNVKGPQFISLHKLFDEVAEEASEASDDLAERAVALGGVAHGTVQSVAHATALGAYPIAAASGAEHVKLLSASIAKFGTVVRAAIETAESAGDRGTADLVTGLSRSIDKLLWFVEAHLQSES